MANIQHWLEQIRRAVYGREVRSSIADAIEAINKEQSYLDGAFDQLIINAGNSNAEVVAARVKADGTQFNTLGERLNKNDEDLLNLSNNFDDISKEVIEARTDKVGVDHGRLKTRLDNMDGQIDDIKRKTRISVTDFGAVGDGQADDTQSFNDAIDFMNSEAEAITVYIPKGTYKITNKLNIINNFKGLCGEEGSILLHTFNGNLIELQGRKNILENFEIRGKSIYSNDFDQFPLQNGIVSKDTDVYDCIFKNLKIACGNSAFNMHFKHSGYYFNNVIEDCILSDNGKYSIYLKGPNSWSWIHCNTFRNCKMESNGCGGINIENWESSQNNKFENLIMDNNGSQYKIETDERFGIYDNTSIYFYNNTYDNIYFENINVPKAHNIDANKKIGALIIDNDFDMFTVNPCVFSNNTRNIYLRVGGVNQLSNKVGTCKIAQSLIGNTDNSINQKAFLEIAGVAPKYIYADIVKTFDIEKYSIPDDFNGKIINSYEKDRVFYRQNVSATHKVFLAKIDTTTKKGIFNNSVKITSYFNHDNNYNQLSLYAEHILLANGNTVSVKKQSSFSNYNINFKFFTYQNAIYMMVYIFGRESYPLLNLAFEGCINLANVEETQYNVLFDGFNIDGTPILKNGVNEINII